MPQVDPTVDTVIRRRLGLRIRRFRERLLVAADEDTYELTDTAAMIFTALDGSTAIGAVGARLAADYDIALEGATADVIDFVRWLLDRNVVEPVPGHASATRT